MLGTAGGVTYAWWLYHADGTLRNNNLIKAGTSCIVTAVSGCAFIRGLLWHKKYKKLIHDLCATPEAHFNNFEGGAKAQSTLFDANHSLKTNGKKEVLEEQGSVDVPKLSSDEPLKKSIAKESCLTYLANEFAKLQKQINLFKKKMGKELDYFICSEFTFDELVANCQKVPMGQNDIKIYDHIFQEYVGITAPLEKRFSTSGHTKNDGSCSIETGHEKRPDFCIKDEGQIIDFSKRAILIYCLYKIIRDPSAVLSIFNMRNHKKCTMYLEKFFFAGKMDDWISDEIQSAFLKHAKSCHRLSQEIDWSEIISEYI